MSRLALLQLAGAVVMLGASWPVTRFAFGRAGLSALAATAVLAGAGLVLGGALTAVLPGQRA